MKKDGGITKVKASIVDVSGNELSETKDQKIVFTAEQMAKSKKSADKNFDAEKSRRFGVHKKWAEDNAYFNSQIKSQSKYE